jgi:putative copper export protein
MSVEYLAISLFIHLVATVIWIGGILITLLLVNPAVRRVLDETPQMYRFLSQLRKGFYPISNLALVALIVTGSFQMTANPLYDGMLTFDNTWSQVMLVKHIAIVGMALAGLLLQYAVSPALERMSLLLERGKGTSETPQTWQSLRRRETLLTWVNGVLGVLVLFFSAWMTAL